MAVELHGPQGEAHRAPHRAERRQGLLRAGPTCGSGGDSTGQCRTGGWPCAKPRLRDRAASTLQGKPPGVHSPCCSERHVPVFAPPGSSCTDVARTSSRPQGPQQPSGRLSGRPSPRAPAFSKHEVVLQLFFFFSSSAVVSARGLCVWPLTWPREATRWDAPAVDDAAAGLCSLPFSCVNVPGKLKGRA